MDFGEGTGCPMPCSSNAVQSGISAAPIRKRRFSSAKIQPTRIKKVMQSDEEIGRMVASVPVAIGRAMEHFAEKLLEASALCVQCSTSRTLSPAHMKQAMLQNRHFAFLEPLMREIAVPGRMGAEMAWHPEMMQQSAIPMPMNMIQPGSVTDGFGAGGMQLAPVQMPMPSFPSAMNVPLGTVVGAKKRQSNGGSAEIPPDGKPKRGRPRKVRKEDRCVEDDGILMDPKESVIPSAVNRIPIVPNGATALSDSELMPPPTMLPPRMTHFQKSIGSSNKSDQLPISLQPPTVMSSLPQTIAPFSSQNTGDPASQ